MIEESDKLMWSALQLQTGVYQLGAWRPSADVYRVKKGWVVKFDLAGIRSEDIQLNVTGRYLRIQGLRRDWSIEKGQQFIQNRHHVDYKKNVPHGRHDSNHRSGNRAS